MIERIRQALDRQAQQVPRSRSRPPAEAAVAAVLFDDDPVRVLFIERATVAGDPWSGHVAFPGGRREPEDESLLATAIRETREELSLDLHHASYLGALDELGPVSRRKPLVVQPHVFHLPRLPSLTPNREVAATLSLPLPDLLQDTGRDAMPFEWDGQAMELARVDFAHVRLWGMTLRIVDDLLHRLDGRGTGLTRVGGHSPF